MVAKAAKMVHGLAASPASTGPRATIVAVDGPVGHSPLRPKSGSASLILIRLSPSSPR